MMNSKGCATTVIQYGSNPGLISTITKKALTEIVEKDEGGFVSENRERLRELVRLGEFARLAQELQVSTFMETDLDTTVSDMSEDEETAYSTWNVIDFEGEMNDRSIIKLGSEVTLSELLERVGVSADKVYYYNKDDGTLVFDMPGKTIAVEGYSGERFFEGRMDAHEEVFSIHDYYTVRDKDGSISYAPTVMFVYRPCELALNSVFHEDNVRMRLITKDRMLSGFEAIGMCVEGKNFSPIYVGTELHYDKDSFETPTVLLVSASALAAIRYMSDHPKEGLLFPEYLDLDEVLKHISPYLPIVTNKI